MNSKIIAAIVGGFIGGAVSGVLGTYFYMKDKCEERIDAEVSAFYSYRDGEVCDEDEEESAVNPASERPTLGDIPKYQTPKDERRNYGAVYEEGDLYKEKSPVELLAEREHPEDSDEDGVEEDFEGDETYLEGAISSQEHEKIVHENISPTVITEAEFEALDGFEPYFLYYWLSDDILADADDEVIEDWEKTVGDSIDDSGWLERLRKNRNSDEKLYIRNWQIGCDYCLEAVNAAYFESR